MCPTCSADVPAVARVDWYRRWIGDYARDTRRLSLAEHGAYTCLLDHYYATEEPLPKDLRELMRICHAESPIERQAVKRVAEKFFPIKGGARHNKRADVEIAKVSRAVQESSEAGKRGAAKRWGNKEIDSTPHRAPHGGPHENPNGVSMALQTPDSRLKSSSVSGEGKPGPRSAASLLTGRNGKHRTQVEDPEENRIARALEHLTKDPATTEAEAARMYRVSIEAIHAAKAAAHEP